MQKPLAHSILNTPKASKLLLTAGLALSLSLLAGCGTPNVGRVVAANCPQAPLLPANLKQLPPEATEDLEALLLSVFPE